MFDVLVVCSHIYCSSIVMLKLFLLKNIMKLFIRFLARLKALKTRYPSRGVLDLNHTHVFSYAQFASYLSHVLGHEGEKSLLEVLKKEGLASGISAGQYESDPFYSTFEISVTVPESTIKEGAIMRVGFTNSLYLSYQIALMTCLKSSLNILTLSSIRLTNGDTKRFFHSFSSLVLCDSIGCRCPSD